MIAAAMADDWGLCDSDYDMRLDLLLAAIVKIKITYCIFLLDYLVYK